MTTKQLIVNNLAFTTFFNPLVEFPPPPQIKKGIQIYSRREETLDSKLNQYPKFHNQDILRPKNLGYYCWILIDQLQTGSVQTFQPIILIYKRGNFDFHHWGCISIYSTMSYPQRSLVILYFGMSFKNFLQKLQGGLRRGRGGVVLQGGASVIIISNLSLRQGKKMI